jgi:ferrous iron transport protein A
MSVSGPVPRFMAGLAGVARNSATPSAAAPEPPAGSSLADLVPGTRAEIVRIDAAGGLTTARRLRDLGFTPGTVVEVVRRAPLRDPVVYRVKDYEICLRRAQAALIRATVTG